MNKIQKSILVVAIAISAIAVGAGLADYANNFKVGGSLSFKATSVASVAGRLTLPAATGTAITMTGTAKITSIVASANIKRGSLLYIYHTSTDTLVAGVNLKIAGNFNGTADDILVLKYGLGTGTIAADTIFYEVSRSAN